MVASWAGTSGWASSSFFGDTPVAPAPTQTASCNQRQTSTISNLVNNVVTNNNNLVATNAPIGSPVDNFEIGDVTDNPEPATWLMMVGGVAVLGYVRKRRNTSV
jgi:hypothetical protein